MGISGLLPFVKKASRPCFLHEFSGSVAAVDTYCWLHKGAFACAEKLVRGEDTDVYVVYVMKMVRLLLSHRIKPIMVFDGCNLPSKTGTEAKRRESRAKNRALAKELLREGRTQEARECFQRCVDVTSHMARAVMTACRQINVDVIVAPYEADAQLAYLAQAGFADLVMTEDSDLILFGCERVIFKLDNSGGGVLVEQDKLHLAMNIPPHKFSLETFRHMCVLSGCDYLPSLPGIGLAKACKFFTLTTNTDVFNALCKMPSYLKMPQLEVPLEYREGFRRAVLTFLHQLVFCPRERRLRPLVEPDDGSEPSDHPYAGAFIGHERALQIALGNIDVQSGQQVDHFHPDRHKAPAMKSSGWGASGDKLAAYSSIWQPDYDRNAFRERCAADKRAGGGKGAGLAAFVANDTRRRDKAERGGGVGQNEENRSLNSSKEKKDTRQHGVVKKVMDIKSMFAKRKREIEDEASDNMSDLLALYRCPTKTPKNEAPDVETPTASTPCRSQAGQEETSATKNLFAKYRRSPSKNPFAKKKLDYSDHLLTSENLSTLKAEEDFNPVGTQSIDTNKEALQVTTSLPNCATTRLKYDPDFKRKDVTDFLLEDDSDISDAVKINESECKTATVAKEKRTVVSNCLADTNTLASIQGKNIILKSKYFRPADSAPARPTLNSDCLKVVPKSSENGPCYEEESTTNDTSHYAVSTSANSAASNRRGSDNDRCQATNVSASTRRRESLLSSSSLSRRFSFQSTKLDPASPSDNVLTLSVNGRVGLPTRNSIDDITSCGPDEATLIPSSPILPQRASLKRRGHKALSLSQKQSDGEASNRSDAADVTDYSASDGCYAQGNGASWAPCSEAFKGSSAAGEVESSQRSCRSGLLDDSCDKESFGPTPLPNVEKKMWDLDSMETCVLVSLSSDDEAPNHSGDDNNEVEDDGSESRWASKSQNVHLKFESEEKSQSFNESQSTTLSNLESGKKSHSFKESQNANLSNLESRLNYQSLQESQHTDLDEPEARFNLADPDSDVATQSSIEEESPFATNTLRPPNSLSGYLVQGSREECNDLIEVGDHLPTELLGKPVSPALVKQQREILKALENNEKTAKSQQASTRSSPYFSKMPASAVKQGSCRRPGLSKPAKGGRQLNLRDMFALKR